jgi:hypothetical protein
MKALILAWLMRQALVQEWLLAAGRPRPSDDEVQWTKDDANALEGFLHTGTGQKLTLLLENLKADADANAILTGTPASAFGLVCVARGVRETVTRIKKLSAVRQPTDSEPAAPSLPAELDHLSET